MTTTTTNTSLARLMYDTRVSIDEARAVCAAPAVVDALAGALARLRAQPGVMGADVSRWLCRERSSTAG